MDETLPVFDTMSKAIMNCMSVVNGDVPPELYLSPVVTRNLRQIWMLQEDEEGASTNTEGVNSTTKTIISKLFKNLI